jgi:hypothetical protein
VSTSTSTEPPIEPPEKKIRVAEEQNGTKKVASYTVDVEMELDKLEKTVPSPEKPIRPTIDLTTELKPKSPAVYSPRRSLLISSLTKNLEKLREKEREGSLLKKALVKRELDSLGEQKKHRQMKEKFLEQQQKLQEQHLLLQQQKHEKMMEKQMQTERQMSQQKGASRRKTGLGVLKVDCDAPPPPPPEPVVEKEKEKEDKKSKDDAKSEKSGEIDRDVFDSLLDFKFVEGIAKLKFLGLYYGFSEFGFPELIPESEIKKGIKTVKRAPAAKSEGRSRIWGRKQDSDEQFLCKNCGNKGNIRMFISPEYCSHECFKEVLQKNREERKAEEKKEVQKPVETKAPAPAKAPPKPRPEEKRGEMETLEIPDEVFSWEDYLGNTTLVAPQSLFNLDFSKLSDNYFEVDMALEAIDPENQSLYCVVSVVDKLGYRIKLHFDGYPDLYDFWVNADSPYIFPTGYCCNTGKQLQPPPGLARSFDWVVYLEASKKKEAPRHLFPNLRKEVSPNCQNFSFQTVNYFKF